MKPKWYSREHWYRMPEREGKLTPASLSISDTIIPRRVIVRCGYYHNYKDAPLQDLNKIAIELMSQRTGHSQDECRNIVQAMEIGHPKGLFSWTQKYRSLRGLYYDARRIWTHRQPAHDGTPFDYRTFWYVNLPTKEEWFDEAAWWDSPLREILAKELRMIGTPDVEYEYGEFGGSYCVGTYFNEHGRQTLYAIAPFTSHIDYADVAWSRYWYVHPLDAEKISDESQV